MKKILRVVAGIFFIAAAAAYFPSVSSILFLLGALIALPIKAIQEPLKKKIPKSSIQVIFCIALFVIGAVIAPEIDHTTSASHTSQEEIAGGTLEEKLDELKSTKSKSETNAETEPDPEEIKYKSGQYKVGNDMPAGEYCLYEDGILPSFTISEDANGDKIIDWHTFGENYIVEVQNGEYFKLSSCYAVPYDGEKIATLKDGYLCEGFYAVGVDIPAGEYKVVEDADSIVASITTYSDLRGDIDDWIVLDGDRYIELKDGQYVSVSDCKIYVGE